MASTSLHVFLTPARHESRFLREATALVRSGLAERVLLLALYDEGLRESERLADGVDVERVRLRTRSLPRLLPFQLIKGVEWRHRIVARAKAVRPSCVVAHSLGALPAAAAAARAVGAALLYDAHELETERNGLRGVRKVLDRIVERALIRRAGAVMCVSDSIADWYASAYGLSRPVVVRNIPDVKSHEAVRDPSVFRERFGIPAEALVFLYQGALSRGRRIEQLLRVFAWTGRHPAQVVERGVGEAGNERVSARPECHVVFMGYGELEGLVRDAAARQANVHFQPAVPPEEVLRLTAGADVGLTGVENVCLSYYYSLPNKLFEYLAAGVPCLVPDYPEMRRLVRQHGCGWVVGEEDDAWATRIDTLTSAEVTERKRAAAAAARVYAWVHEEGVFLDVYRKLLSERGLNA